MGMCLPCLSGTADDYDQPDPEERRRQAAIAAEQRQKAEESRGVKDPEALKRKQQERERIEKQAESRGMTGDGEGLKWQVS